MVVVMNQARAVPFPAVPSRAAGVDLRNGGL